MHELAVTQALLASVCQTATESGAKRVTEVYLVLGDLSSCVDDSVQLYFTMLSEGSIAEGARLIFRRVPMQLQCSACSRQYDKPRIGFACPRCGAEGRLLRHLAIECTVEKIEVEM